MKKTILFVLLICASPALAETPRVMTDIPVVHSLVAQVMDGAGEPSVLLDRGSSPHSFQLRPSQARALSQADILFWVGPELTPWLERTIEGMGLSGKQVELLKAEPTLRRYFGADDQSEHGDHDDAGHEAHAVEEGEEHAGHSDHDHAHEGLDPHAWLDPENARIWLGLIAARLAEVDPQHAALYMANARAAQGRIDTMSAEVAALLEPVHEKPFVVFHDAYGYLTARFDLNMVGALQPGDAAAAGAARLSALRAKLEQEGVVCAFTEAQHDPAQLQVLAEGTGVKFGQLDPSGSSLDYGPQLYEQLITGLAKEISTCLGE